MRRPPVRPGPAVAHVVIPAHDEEELLPRCLDSVERAVALARQVHPEITTRVTVVPDRCRDRTAAIAAGYTGVDVIEVDAGRVGHARRAGVLRAVELSLGTDHDQVWIANTDADTVVPEHWLVSQLLLARLEFSLVIGSVRPDPIDTDPRTLTAWRDRHRLHEGHTHVHGANLGFSLASYLAVGGFSAVAAHEDVLLVEAMRGSGIRWCATTTTQVMTSGRQPGRAPDGFADYLAALDDAAPAS